MNRHFITSLAALSAMLTFALHGPAAAASLDGEWIGKWTPGGPTRIVISGGQVTRYFFNFKPVPVVSSSVTDTSAQVYVGDGTATITLSRTGAKTAHASFTSTSNGSAEANLRLDPHPKYQGQ